MAHSPKKILIVDDSAVVRDAVALMLEERGFVVVAMDTIFSFAQTLNHEKPDLVLIDVNMPAMTGDKLVQITHKYQAVKCPILLFSDKDPFELSRLAKECGAAGFIPKTGDGDKLASSITAYLASARK